MADKVEKRILTLYSDVQATSVHWLWYPFIAVGKITLLQGDPGDGKSTMMMNLIAELSKGGKTPDVIMAMADCGFSKKDIRRVVGQLYEVFCTEVLAA